MKVKEGRRPWILIIGFILISLYSLQLIISSIRGGMYGFELDSLIYSIVFSILAVGSILLTYAILRNRNLYLWTKEWISLSAPFFIGFIVGFVWARFSNLAGGLYEGLFALVSLFGASILLTIWAIGRFVIYLKTREGMFPWWAFIPIAIMVIIMIVSF